MKKFLLTLGSIFEDNPFGVVIVTLILFLVLAQPATDLLSMFFPLVYARVITITCLFSIGGLLGILMIKYREAPIIYPFIKGIPAVIIGTALAISSFGIVIWAIVKLFVRNNP